MFSGGGGVQWSFNLCPIVRNVCFQKAVTCMFQNYQPINPLIRKVESQKVIPQC